MRAILAAVVAASLSAACTQSTDPTTTTHWIDRLENPKQRIQALKELGKLGKPEALPHIVHWFQKEGAWQPNAAYAIGQLGDEAAAKTLIAGIDYAVGTGQDRFTRNKNRTNLNIARALAMLKSPQAVEPLIRLLRTPEPKTREAVIRALGDLGFEEAVTPLCEIAQNDPEAFLRKVAVQSLGTLGSAKATDTLIKMLFVEVPGISFYNEARYSLLQLGKPTVPKLLATLKRENPVVETIKLADGSPLAPGAIEAKAGFVLGALAAQEAKVPMLAALTKLFQRFEQRDSVPVFASIPGAIIELSYAVANLDGADVVRTLERVAKTTDSNVRKAAVDALTHIGARASTRTLFAVAKKGPQAARRAAVQGLSRLAGGDDLNNYDALARSGDKQTSPETMATIVKEERSRLLAANECGKQKDCWHNKLRDVDSKVRERAAYELGWLEAEDEIPSLLRAAEDEDANVRMAALVSLRRFDDNVDANQLQAIHDSWSKKIEYAGVNQELKRLIARVRNARQ